MSRWSGSVFLFAALSFLVTRADAAIPNDPFFEVQWGLRNTGQTIEGQAGTIGADVDALGAWEIHPGTSSVVVAIVGRGVDPHPEFADRLLEGAAFVGDLYDTRDSCPHDTHLAGIIAAARGNGVGISGLNGSAYLLPVRVLDGCGGTPASTAKGIIWAVDHGAGVILAAVQFSEGTPELAASLAYALNNDVVVVAPSGNSGDGGVAFPAAYGGCVAVTASTNQDLRSTSSNYGPEVDVTAPGRWVWSTWAAAGYAYQPDGRDAASASAFVAGVAALMRSYAPQISAPQLAQILVDSADDLGPPGRDDYFGAGRVNARRALQLTPAPPLRFEHLDEFPSTIPPNAPSSYIVRIAEAGESLAANGAFMHYRTGPGQFTARSLVPLRNDLFLVEFPAVGCKSRLEYYFSATGTGGSLVTDPRDAPGELYTAEAVVWQTLFDDDFETDLGWEIEGGDNTSGRWSRVIPVGTSAQPGFDYSPDDSGSHCFVTGQHFSGSEGSNDVDGGPVRLTSPAIALSTADAEVSYARWFHWGGTGQEDRLTVEVSRDGGRSWTTVETVGTTGEWIAHSFRLFQYPQAAGNELRVRFSAADIPSDSLTEAAVDQFRVRAIHCAAIPGDANYDGVISLLDFRYVVQCWLGPGRQAADGPCMPLDFDGDRQVDLRDYRSFQNAFGR